MNRVLELQKLDATTAEIDNAWSTLSGGVCGATGWSTVSVAFCGFQKN